MSDDTGAGEAQGAAQAQSQGDQSQAQGAATAQAQGASGAAGADADRDPRDAKIAALEKDNFTYRQQLKDQAEAAKKSKAAAEKSVEEQVKELQQQLDAERSQRQEQSLRLATVTQATRLGYRNPDLAYRLLDAAAVEYADDGSPTNIEQLLQALAKSDPYLLAETDFGGGKRGASPDTSADMNTLIRQAAGRQ